MSFDIICAGKRKLYSSLSSWRHFEGNSCRVQRRLGQTRHTRYTQLAFAQHVSSSHQTLHSGRH